MSLYKMLNKVECTEDGSLDLVIKGFVVFHPFEALPDRAGLYPQGADVLSETLKVCGLSTDPSTDCHHNIAGSVNKFTFTIQ